MPGAEGFDGTSKGRGKDELPRGGRSRKYMVLQSDFFDSIFFLFLIILFQNEY